MARIRTIKPEFFTSEQVAECSTSARLLFVGMWCFCDDAGIHPASYKSLKMQIFPGDDLTINQIKKYVAELINNSLLIQYTIDNQTYWQVTGWHHQKIDRPNFKYPKPENSEIIRRVLDEHSPPEGKGRESKGEEGREKEKARARISLEELSVEHIKDWLAEKRIAGKYLHHDENFIIEYFKNYCRSKSKTYTDYIAALRNAFEWESCQPKGNAYENARQFNGKSDKPNKDERARAAVMRAAERLGFANPAQSGRTATLGDAPVSGFPGDEDLR